MFISGILSLITGHNYTICKSRSHFPKTIHNLVCPDFPIKSVSTPSVESSVEHFSYLPNSESILRMSVRQSSLNSTASPRTRVLRSTISNHLPILIVITFCPVFQSVMAKRGLSSSISYNVCNAVSMNPCSSLSRNSFKQCLRSDAFPISVGTTKFLPSL